MTDYPMPEGAELVTARLIAGRYRIIRLASGRIALLRKDGLVKIAHTIINNMLKERYNV
jgi:hypothetical protein